MTSYMALALRRNRLLFIGLAACFVVSLPFAVVLLKASGHPGDAGLNGALAFWLLAGLPGAAVLFGASSGVRLRQESEQSAEQPLPLSPRARIVSACLAACVHVLLLSLVVVLTVFILGKGWFAAPDKVETWINTYPELHGFMMVIGFATAHLAVTGFLLAYLIGNGILGGMLALAASLAPAACLALMLALQGEYEGQAPFSPLGPLCMLAAFAGCLWAFSAAPAWVERRKRATWPAIAGVAVGVLLGVLSSAASLAYRWDSLNRSLSPIWDVANANSFLLPIERLMPGIGEITARGLLLKSVRGDLVWVTREGARTLIAAENRSLRDLIDYPWLRRVLSTAWEEDGSLWVLGSEGVFDQSTCQLWHGRPGEGFALHTSFGGSGSDYQGLVRRGRELGLSRYNPGNFGEEYAPLPEKGKAPLWRSMGKSVMSVEFLGKAWTDEGKAAWIDEDERTLRRGRRSWKIPGKAEAPDYSVPYETKDGELFLIPFRTRQATSALAVCRPDGSVRTEWPNPRKSGEYWFTTLPDGTIWSHLGRRLLVLTRDGAFHPPMDLAPVLDAVRSLGGNADPMLAKVDGDALWLFYPLLERPCLIRVDWKSGKVLVKRVLPPIHEDASRVTEDGVLLLTGAKLMFFGFDGTSKELPRI